MRIPSWDAGGRGGALAPPSRCALLVATFTFLPLGCTLSHRQSSEASAADADSDSDTDSDADDPCLEPDEDGDGVESTMCGGDDCNDADPTIRPDARDLVGDGIDQGCDGVDGRDGDGDGWASEPSGGDDCDDADPGIHPAAADEDVDGIDQDCDGIDGPDADGDGHADEAVGGDDCDDADPAIHPGAPDEAEWVAERVRDSASYCTVSVAPDGLVHIVHGGVGGVQHTWKEDGEWESEVVYARGGVPVHRIDGDGVLHVAIASVDGLRYATDAGDEWEVELTDPWLGEVRRPSLAVDEGGFVHVSGGQQYGAHSELVYVTNEGGEWTHVTVDESDDWGAVGRMSSIGVDRDGSVQIAYTAERTTRLAVLREGEWSIEIVYDRESSAPTLLLDADGVPHVLASGSGIEHFSRSGGGWTGERLAPSGMFSATFDSTNVLHLVRHDLAGPRLAYGTLEEGVFEEESVEPAGDGGGEISLAVASGAVHVAFAAGSLWYVQRELPDGIDQDCDGEAW